MRHPEREPVVAVLLVLRRAYGILDQLKGVEEQALQQRWVLGCAWCAGRLDQLEGAEEQALQQRMGGVRVCRTRLSTHPLTTCRAATAWLEGRAGLTAVLT